MKKITVESEKEVKEIKVEKPVETVAKKAEEKKAEEKKTVKKTTTKATTKTAAKTVKPAAKAKTAATAKTTAKQTTYECMIQFAGNETTTEAVYEKIKADYVAAGNKETTFKNVKVYLKPEEQMAYYVVDEKYNAAVSLF